MNLEKLKEAIRLHEAGNIDEADAIYVELCAESPWNALLLNFRGLVAGARHQYETAIRLLGQAIALDCRNAAFVNNLGEVYRQVGDLVTALNLFRFSEALDSSLPMPSLNQGLIWVELGRLHSAVPCFMRTIDAKPDFPKSYEALASILLAANQATLASLASHISSVVLAVPSDPRSGFAEDILGPALVISSLSESELELRLQMLRCLGSALKKRGHLKKAADCVVEALRCRPSDSNLLLNLAVLYESLDDLAAAAETLERHTLQGQSCSSDYDRVVPLYRLKFAFLKPDFLKILERHILQEVEATQPHLLSERWRTEKVLANLMSKIIKLRWMKDGVYRPRCVQTLVHLVGDSHVLSLAYTSLTISGTAHTVFPHLITGLKAFHVAAAYAGNTAPHPFLPSCHLRSVLANMAASTSLQRPIVLFLCGEIDCRWEEGIGLAVRRGDYRSLEDGVLATVSSYVSALQKLQELLHLVILVLPVVYPRPTLQPNNPLDAYRRTLIDLFNRALQLVLSGAPPMPGPRPTSRSESESEPRHDFPGPSPVGGGGGQSRSSLSVDLSSASQSGVSPSGPLSGVCQARSESGVDSDTPGADGRPIGAAQSGGQTRSWSSSRGDLSGVGHSRSSTEQSDTLSADGRPVGAAQSGGRTRSRSLSRGDLSGVGHSCSTTEQLPDSDAPRSDSDPVGAAQSGGRPRSSSGGDLSGVDHSSSSTEQLPDGQTRSESWVDSDSDTTTGAECRPVGAAQSRDVTTTSGFQSRDCRSRSPGQSRDSDKGLSSVSQIERPLVDTDTRLPSPSLKIEPKPSPDSVESHVELKSNKHVHLVSHACADEVRVQDVRSSGLKIELLDFADDLLAVAMASNQDEFYLDAVHLSDKHLPLLQDRLNKTCFS